MTNHKGGRRPTGATNKRRFRWPLEGTAVIVALFGGAVQSSAAHPVIAMWIYATATAIGAFGLPAPASLSAAVSGVAFIVVALLTLEQFTVAPASKLENKIIPQFSVVSEHWIHGEKRHKSEYFIVHGYGKLQIASPVNDILYVRFTNTGAEPL